MGRILNKPTPTIINTELRPFDESFHIETNGQTEQWFYDNTSQYAPDRAITPLILSPVLSVFDAEEQKSYSTEITDIAEEGHLAFNYVSWYVLEYNATTGQYAESEVTATQNGQNVYYILQGHNLIVKKNVSYEHGVTVRCKACYIDPRDAGVTYIVEETLVLSTNRDATVILPEVDIISPSARAFNPLTDYDEQGNPLSEFEFEGVVKNSPDVERVTSSDLAEYKVDGWGTEEIVSASESCAPTLTIRYPDGSIETDARFMYRKTADGTKLDMGGKVISWNQKISNGDFSDGTTGWNKTGNAAISASNGVLTITKSTSTYGTGAVAKQQIANTITTHKYYLSCYAKTNGSHTFALGFFNAEDGGTSGNTVVDSDSTTYVKLALITSPISGTNMYGVRCGVSSTPVGATIDVHSCMCIDLTTIYGSGKEPTSVAQFESDYRMWFGKPLSYEEYDAGSQRQTLAPSNAFVTNIKGNTVKWSQKLVQTTVTTSSYFATLSEPFNAVNGRKYYVSFDAVMTEDGSRNVVLGNGNSFVSNTITVTCTANKKIRVEGVLTASYSGSVRLKTANAGISITVSRQIVVDLSLLYGLKNEPSATTFAADYLKWYGKSLVDEPQQAAKIRPVKMVSMKTVGFNLMNYETDYVASGNYEITDGGWRIRKIQMRPNTTYRISKAATSTYDDVYRLTLNNSLPITGTGSFTTRTTDAKTATYTTGEEGYLYIGYWNSSAAGNKENEIARLREMKLSITLDVDNVRSGYYEPYWSNKSMLNVTELKGRVVTNGQATGNPVTIFPDGMKRARNVYDEIYMENGKIYAKKRVGAIDLGTLNWSENSADYITYSAPISGYAFIQTFAGISNFVSDRYIDGSVQNMSEQAATMAVRSGAIHVITTVATAAAFKTSAAGSIVYCELTNPVTYEIDEIQSPFIFKWFGINSSGQEVDATTMPWYKEGQDTSKLKVDAMYGENINVVLRCTKGAGLKELSPSKAYAAVAWKVPDVDTHVVSYNGGAVRNGTGDMEFGTIVNVNGNVLPDTVKNTHLRFNWKYRHSTSTTVNDAGWGSTIDIARSTLMHVRSVVGAALASTHVYPEVYLLGAWKPATNTTTPYDKPTTTKDGTSYERTID